MTKTLPGFDVTAPKNISRFNKGSFLPVNSLPRPRAAFKISFLMNCKLLAFHGVYSIRKKAQMEGRSLIKHLSSGLQHN